MRSLSKDKGWLSIEFNVDTKGHPNSLSENRYKQRGNFDQRKDIRELSPSLSIGSLEDALRKLVESGELKREGSGKNINYYRPQ